MDRTTLTTLNQALTADLNVLSKLLKTLQDIYILKEFLDSARPRTPTPHGRGGAMVAGVHHTRGYRKRPQRRDLQG